MNSADGNGECGPFQNSNFGKLNIRTRYADDVTRGFGNRDFNWDIATEVQQEVMPGMSVTAGYYRNWFGNLSTTDNLA